MKRPVAHPEFPQFVLTRLQPAGGDTYRLVPVNVKSNGDGETWVSARQAATVLGLPWKEKGGCEPLRRLRISERHGKPLLVHRRTTPHRIEYELGSLQQHLQAAKDPDFWESVRWNGH